MREFTETIPLSLYIHMPWCVRKCPYCDFNSHALSGKIPEETYIDALIEDLEQSLPMIWGRRLTSIFFGGGTPSLFSPASLDRLLREFHARLNYSASIEITLEANPGTVEQTRFTGFREAGINRLSIGVQSFQDDKLKTLGRIHSSDEAKKAINGAQKAGFTNFNIDLMHGLPDQSAEDACLDINDALAFDPTHLSWYQLTIEPNTLFYKKTPTLPNEDTLFTIETEGKKRLAAANFKQYETSAFCLDGHQALHNINYWQFGDYLGIGAGAHSKLTDVATSTVTRLRKTRLPRDYLDKNKTFTAHENRLTDSELCFEFMLNTLRLHQPIPFDLFQARTGLSATRILTTLKQAQKDDLIQLNAKHFQTTKKGRRFLNDLQAMFLES